MKKIYFLPLFAFLLTSAKSINLIPGGQNIGIEIRTDGLIVSGTYDLKLENGSIYNPSKNSDINRGDIIIKANNKAVNSLNDLISVFSNNELIEPKINLTIPLKHFGTFLTTIVIYSSYFPNKNLIPPNKHSYPHNEDPDNWR